MEKQKNTGFYKASTISPGFKLIIGLLLFIGVGFIGYSEYQAGESIYTVIIMIASILGFVAILLWFFPQLKRVQNLNTLSEKETFYVDDIKTMKITEIVKKTIL